MLVYLINIALILLWGVVLLKHKPTDKKRKIFCSIAALQWILISGLRSPYMSADVYINYSRYFEDMKTTSWAEVISNNIKYVLSFGNNNTDIDDPGYELFMKLCQIFSDNFQVFLLIVAVVFTVPMAIWIYKNSSAPDMSFVIYSVLFYSFFAITGIRQTIATAIIVFCGYKFVKERKPVKFFILAFIAFMIHKSAFVFIPYYFVASIPITFPYLIVAFAVVVLFYLFGAQLYTPLATFIGYDENLYEGTVGGGQLYALLMVCICIAIIFFYPLIHKHREDAKYWCNLLLFSILTSLLVLQVQGFMRIQQYFTLSLMVLLPEVVMCIERKHRNVVHYATIAVMVMYLIMNRPTYMFFWQ